MEYNKETHYKTNNTKFKLVCWYSHKKNGIPYDPSEITTGKNRKPLDSYDFSYTNDGRTITNHRRAFKEILEHVEKYGSRIITAELYVNDLIQEKQFVIGSWSNNRWIKLIPPVFEKKVFSQVDLSGTTHEVTQVYYKGLTADPIRTDRLEQFIIERKFKREAL